MHRAYIGLGSNLGDRRANIIAALQRLRARARVETVSDFYESAPAQGAEGPSFLNVAAEVATESDRAAFVREIEDVQRAVGRLVRERLRARPIDVDLLVFDDWQRQDLASRPYNVVPLAEIAPEYASLAAGDGTVRRHGGPLRFSTDRQDAVPAVRISLNRAGVSRIRRTLRLNVDGKSTVFQGEFSMIADLPPDRAGVHMSRFVEILEEATLDVLARDRAPLRIEDLAEAVAREIVTTQGAQAEVRLRADFSLERWTPVSGKRGEETYALLGIARVSGASARRMIGVEAEGMTACPCAQGMIREHSLHDLREAGFTDDQARLALDTLPGATHNQRGTGAVLVGATAPEELLQIRVEDLVEIVEGAMSSETYDLLKRPDEFFVVNKAHRNPKFVEDVVREIVGRTLEVYDGFSDDAFVFASQRNEESIHKHDAFAEVFGRFGEFREELRAGAPVMPKMDSAAWLRGQRSASAATDES